MAEFILPETLSELRRGVHGVVPFWAGSLDNGVVLLVCKGPIGRGTSTSSTGGRVTVATPRLGFERNFRDALEAGRYLNNEALATMLVGEGRRSVELLPKFGLQLHPAPKGWHLLLEAGHPYLTGIALSRALVGVYWPYRRASASFSPREGALSVAAEVVRRGWELTTGVNEVIKEL